MKPGTQEYNTLHKWAQQHVTIGLECQECGTDKSLQRANVSGEYRRDPSDYITLCAKCHHIYDDVYAKNIARTKAYWEQRVYCRNGHELQVVGFYQSTSRSSGRITRICKECHRIHKMTYRHNLRKEIA